MKRITYLTFAATMLCSSMSGVQHSRGNDPIRVVLPRTVDTRNCQLHYFLVGPFGGYGGSVWPGLDASELVIATVHEGEAAERLTAVLYCSGYQIETIAFDSLHHLEGGNIHLDPKPLGTVRFRGVVRGLISQNVTVLHVDADYTPSWMCELFHLLDCGLSGWTVESAKVDTDGTFSATLPDFARDPVIRSFKDPGTFAFRIRDQKTGNPLFELKQAASNSPLSRVPVANDYPGEHVFDAESPR
jgi:hypothetical protein